MAQRGAPTTATRPADTGGGAALFIRRPVLAIVLNLLIVVAGLAAFSGVEVRELPSVDRPVVTIRTTYDGATPETIDKEVTSLIEGAAARIPGVVSISSSSSSGESRVSVEFDAKIDINVAANDLRDAVGNIARRLPEDADAPTIVKADADSDAIIRLSIASPTRKIEDLTRIVEDQISDRLAAVEGVADVQIYGSREPLVRVILRPEELAARGLSVSDIDTALSSVALDVPAGQMSDLRRSLLVRADASVKNAEDIEAIEINPTTKVGDIADVIFGPAEKTTSLRVNGERAIGAGIIRQAQSNTLSISTGVAKAVDELNASLPDDITVRVTSDDAVFIHGAVEEVLLTLVLATSIVIAIIYLFLRSVRITFIPAITVPIALIGALAAIYMVGFSINILTLLALVLATGMVVDDAIVVIENIARKRADGLGPRAAAVLGTKQVFFAVISTTATLAAVFIPISFFPGTAGRLFSEFGFVLAFAVVLSAVVALTLAPMLAARLLHKEDLEESHNSAGKAVANVGDAAANLYLKLLDFCLARPYLIVAVSLGFAGAAAVSYKLLPEELTPPEDRGVIFASVQAPQGATIDYTEEQMRRVEAVAQTFIKSGEATNIFSIAGPGGAARGFVSITLAPWHDRSRNQLAITADFNRAVSRIPGVQVFARTGNSLGIRGGGDGLTFAVTGTDYTALATAAEKLVAKMSENPNISQPRLAYDTTQPQLSIDIDRRRAADLGVPIAGIATVVRTLLEGRDIGEFYVGDDAITVRAEAPRGMIQDTESLQNIQVRTSSGAMVPLSALVSFSESAVAPSLQRVDQRRSVPVSANLVDGYDLRRAMNDVSVLAKQTIDPGMSIQFTGTAQRLNETSGGVARTFVFALIVVLLVLAAQFESFVSAAILIATVPFGLAAAVFAMLLTGGSLNIYSQIGLVMIVGLMSKNGILIVEFANQLRDEGEDVLSSIRDACRIRLRPVVMTMVSTVLGGLPLIIRSGPGAEARQALGWIIVGGLGFATLATLFLTPVVYRLLAGFSKPRAAESERLASELEAAERRPRLRAAKSDDDSLPIAAE